MKFGFDCGGDVAAIVAKVNKNMFPLNKTLKTGILFISNGDSIQFYATSPFGCKVNASIKTVKLNAKPNPSFTYASSKR